MLLCCHGVHPVMLAPMLVIGCGWVTITMEDMRGGRGSIVIGSQLTSGVYEQFAAILTVADAWAPNILRPRVDQLTIYYLIDDQSTIGLA